MWPSSIANTYGFALDGLVSFSPSAQPQPIRNFIRIAVAETFSFDGTSNVSRSFTVSLVGVCNRLQHGHHELELYWLRRVPGRRRTLVVVSGGREIKTTVATSAACSPAPLRARQRSNFA